jgi:hypothetical protein
VARAKAAASRTHLPRMDHSQWLRPSSHK